MMMDDGVVESTQQQQQQTCCQACHQPCIGIDPIRIRGETYHPTCLVCEVSAFFLSIPYERRSVSVSTLASDKGSIVRGYEQGYAKKSPGRLQVWIKRRKGNDHSYALGRRLLH